MTEGQTVTASQKITVFFFLAMLTVFNESPLTLLEQHHTGNYEEKTNRLPEEQHVFIPVLKGRQLWQH